MARARNIKPSFFKNEHLAELPPEARLLFIGLWTLADCEGRLEDRPKRIKGELFPFDDVDVDAYLSLLFNSEDQFIIRYQVEGKNYIQIRNFKAHQNPHKKEKDAGSQFPGMNEQVQINPEPAPEIPEQAQTLPERAGLIPDSLLLIPDSLTPESARDEFDDFAKDGLKIANESGNTNIQNWAWVPSYLRSQAKALKTEKPELPVSEMLRIWQNCCVLASSKTVSSARWYQSVFESETAKWHPKAKGLPPAAMAPKKSRLQLLLDAIGNGLPIKDLVTGQIIQAHRLKFDNRVINPSFKLLDDPEGATREASMLEVAP